MKLSNEPLAFEYFQKFRMLLITGTRYNIEFNLPVLPIIDICLVQELLANDVILSLLEYCILMHAKNCFLEFNKVNSNDVERAWDRWEYNKWCFASFND